MTQHNEERLSLENFKKWMKHQESDSSPSHKLKRYRPLIGLQVESKLDAHRLAAKMQIEEGDVEDLINNFLESGGVIANLNEKHFLVEVETGSFYIHRCHVRKS